LGSRSLAGGSIHAAGCLYSFAANWSAVTSSLRASLVTVERGHDNGSMTVMICGGAMRSAEEREARRKCYAMAKEQVRLGSERDEDDKR
jgi:hypothetical protein